MYYHQCSLEKPTKTGKLIYVAYIPYEFAKLGRLIKIKREDIWEDGWTVAKVGPRVDEKCLPDAHAEVKAHRKRTGDSLPKKA